jgi:hypothetical protein
LLETDYIEVISNEMRAIVESEWPELAYKLLPKEPGGAVSNPRKSAFARWARELLAFAAEVCIIAWSVVIFTAVLWAVFDEPE